MLKDKYHDLYYDVWVKNFGEFRAPNGEYVPDVAERMYDATLDIAKENTKLKELLKECRRPVCWYVDIFKNKAELLAQIIQALGEDK